jgi:glycopeptide antibiotics resistance protein
MIQYLLTVIAMTAMAFGVMSIATDYATVFLTIPISIPFLLSWRVWEFIPEWMMYGIFNAILFIPILIRVYFQSTKKFWKVQLAVLGIYTGMNIPVFLYLMGEASV